MADGSFDDAMDMKPDTKPTLSDFEELDDQAELEQLEAGTFRLLVSHNY